MRVGVRATLGFLLRANLTVGRSRLPFEFSGGKTLPSQVTGLTFLLLIVTACIAEVSTSGDTLASREEVTETLQTTQQKSSADSDEVSQLREKVVDLSARVSSLELQANSAWERATEARVRARHLQLPAGDPRRAASVQVCPQVSGSLGADWEAKSLNVGALHLIAVDELAAAPPSDFEADEVGRYGGTKVLAVVERWHVATLVVPNPEADRLSLLYDPSIRSPDNRFAVRDGEEAVSLVACYARLTQFPGGFVVAAAHCAPLDVYLNEESEPQRVVLSFGAGSCEQQG